GCGRCGGIDRAACRAYAHVDWQRGWCVRFMLSRSSLMRVETRLREVETMPKYMFIFRGGEPEIPNLSPTEMEAHLRKWYAWAGERAQSGRYAGGQPRDGMGKTIRGRNRTVTDGPYAESKDLVTGSLVIEASSLEEATELHMACPVFEFDG